MHFRFTLADAAQWAAFSGDFNPIHFDLAAAKLLGAEQLIVHGMLALAHVKGALGKTPHDAGTWIHTRNLFRSPMQQGATLQLAIGSDGKYQVYATESGIECLRGHRKAITAPTIVQDGHVQAKWPIERERLTAFETAYPALALPWLMVEAAVFASLMRTHIHSVFACATEQLGEQRIEAARARTIVHSSQTVAYDAHYFSQPDAIHSRLDCSMGTPDLIANKDRIICSIPLVVSAPHAPVLQIEVGVVAVLSPNLNVPKPPT